MQNCDVDNCKIRGIGANSSQIGGIAGTTRGPADGCSVSNSIVEGNGTDIGGIHGYGAGAQESFVYNTEITGYSNVGGIMGELITYAGQVIHCYVNGKIHAISNNDGGLVGYVNNINATDVSKTTVKQSAVYNSIIEGKSNVGGVIGEIAEEPQDITWFYRNYVEASLYGESSSISLGIGSNQQYNALLEDLHIYKYSTINDEFPNEQTEIFIPEEAYLTTEDLKEQETYTSKLKWPKSYWNFDSLKNNKYPTLTNSYLPSQTGVDIPINPEQSIENDENSGVTQNIENEEQLEQTFEYENKAIQTYNTCSIITDSEGNKIARDTKLYVKDNKLYAIPVSLSELVNDKERITPVADNLILDSYNGKEYETVLGSDGKLYDLKEPLTYPKDFVNEDIESIGNNLNSDSHEIEIIYKNGDKIKFNYQTGEMISSSESRTSDGVGLLDYIKEKISKIGHSNSSLSQELVNKYEESKELQTKLEARPIEKAIEEQNNGSSSTVNSAEDTQGNLQKDNNEANTSNENDKEDNIATEDDKEGVTTTESDETNNSLKENKYINMYNQETGEYEIYNEEELLDTSIEEVVSENEKIEANNLSEYYASEGKTKNTKLGIVWIVLSIIGVGIILFVLKKNLKKKSA